MAVRSQVSNWQQVADLKPQLRKHVRTYPQDYRGERWYVLRDESNGRLLRFNSMAYDFIGRLDGDLSVQQIWDRMTVTAEEDGNLLEQDERSSMGGIFITRRGLDSLPHIDGWLV